MAEPKFRKPAERRTKPLPAGGAPQFEFKVQKEKAKTGKQIFREKLLSDEGMPALYNKVCRDVSLHGDDPVGDLKKVLWHVRDWQHNLFPRMKFDSFMRYTTAIKTYKYDIEQTLEKLHAASEPKSEAPEASSVVEAAPADFAEYECEPDPDEEKFAAYPQAKNDDPPVVSQVTYFKPKSSQAPSASPQVETQDVEATSIAVPSTNNEGSLHLITDDSCISPSAESLKRVATIDTDEIPEAKKARVEVVEAQEEYQFG